VAVGVTTHRASPHLCLIQFQSVLLLSFVSLSCCDGFCGTLQGLRMPDERSCVTRAVPVLEYAIPLPLLAVRFTQHQPLSNVSDFIASLAMG
jgi:hypothetical protein